MPAKKTTIAAAEKRVIKAEIATMKRNLRKVHSDCRRERKAYGQLLRQWDTKLKRLNKTEARELASATRRIAILEGRLHS